MSSHCYYTVPAEQSDELSARPTSPQKRVEERTAWKPTAMPVGLPLSPPAKLAFPMSTERDTNGAQQPRSKQGRSAGERKVGVQGKEAANQTGEESNQVSWNRINSHLHVLVEAWARRSYTERWCPSSRAKEPARELRQDQG